MHPLVPTLALLLAVALLAACGGEEAAPTGTPGPEKPSTPAGPGEPSVPAPPAGPGEPSVPAPPADPGKALLTASCTSCHGVEKVTSARMSKEDWADQVEACTSEAPLDEEVAAKLVDYLARTYGE